MNKILTVLLTTSLAFAFSMNANAADATAKAKYNATKDTAAADYKTASTQCDSLSGNGKDVCIAEAKAARTNTVANAEVQYKNTAKARASARKDIADANYAVAKTKCGSKGGNDKDVCIKEAKAAKTAQIADAEANQKTSEAVTTATGDKRDADYDVAIQKCDALAGVSKDSCVANAKAKFHK